MTIIQGIDDRLQGKVGPGLPLSVEGQVHQQIQEAVSLDNLSQVSYLINQSIPLIFRPSLLSNQPLIYYSFFLLSWTDVYRLGSLAVTSQNRNKESFQLNG